MMLSLAALALATRVIAGSRAELMDALGNLRHVSWAWVSLAVVAEGCSFAAMALAQRRLLRAGGVTVRARFLGPLAVASQAIGSVLPAGYLTSNAVVLGVMARRGVGKVMTLWMLAVAGFLYIVALVVIGLVGAQLAGAGRNAPNLRPIGAVVLGAMAAAVVAGMTAGRLRRRPWSVHELAARMPGGPLKRLIGGDVLAKVSLGPRGWGAGFLWMLLYWAGDVACLAIAFPAVAGTTPWRGLLLAYAAGQLAALLPVTPGGLGATEGSMGLALAAYGAGPGALSAVLLYRLITYWAVLPVGGACYLWLLRRRPDRSRPAARWRATMGFTLLAARRAAARVQDVPKRILVVDDNEYFRRTASELLAARGFGLVDLAADGAEAMAAAAAACPDGVLLDINLPGQDGFVIAAAFAEACPSARIVLTSADVEDVPGPALRSCGACAFVPKTELVLADLHLLFAF